jgi:hypothetical protein
MNFIFDNQSIITNLSKKILPLDAKQIYGKVAFVYENGKEEDSTDEIVLLHKIVAAVGQDVANSVIIKLDTFDFAHHTLATHGIQALICFSNYRIKKWEGVNYQINKPFFIQELQVFQTCSLEQLASSADMKTKLWAFLKQAAI